MVVAIGTAKSHKTAVNLKLQERVLRWHYRKILRKSEALTNSESGQCNITTCKQGCGVNQYVKAIFRLTTNVQVVLNWTV